MKIKLSVSVILIIGLFQISCDKEVEDTGEVLFSYKTDGRVVAFINESNIVGEVSYNWDFGDETALVTEANPTHEYARDGDYTVILTAKTNGGEKVYKETISLIDLWRDMAIDGSFNDWDAVEPFYSGYGAASGNLTVAKLASEASISKLYVYIKGDLNPTYHVLQIIIDADGDASTGWNTSYRYATCGAEYFYEYYVQPKPMWSGLYGWKSDPANQGWPWTIDLTTDKVKGMILESSGVIGDTVIEFTIDLTQMLSPTVSNKQIGVLFWSQNTDWCMGGMLPPGWADPLESVKMYSFQ